MKTLHFEIEIKAPVATVHTTMLDTEHFKDWISAFHPNSWFQGSWEKGATIQFLAKDDDGTLNGMSSRIRDHKPNELVRIEHQDYIKNGRVVTEDDGTESFSGALEEYHFEAIENGTRLKVRADTTKKYEDYFKETWPKALKRLKELCEREA